MTGWPLTFVVVLQVAWVGAEGSKRPELKVRVRSPAGERDPSYL